VTNTAILAASGLLLLAYGIEHFGRRFRVPSVVLLIVAGLIARQVLDAFGWRFHWVEPIVPVIGTIGLILIVLEGALDLTVTRKPARDQRRRSGASSLAGFLAIARRVRADLRPGLPGTSVPKVRRSWPRFRLPS
jgi:Kef-type K+ transport system membrane component KefB